MDFLREFQSLVAGLVGFGGVILTLVVNSWLSRRQHRQERQSHAFEQLLAALHELKRFPENWLEAEFAGRELTEERAEELRLASKIGNNKLQKMKDVSIIFLPKSVEERLNRLESELNTAEKFESLFEHLENDHFVVQNCINDIVAIYRRM